MRFVAFCLLAAAAVAVAQENPVSSFNRMGYAQLKMWVGKSAEKMPEENYSFKPTPDVRSFGQLIGHIADSQYGFCSSVLGEKNPAPGIEKNKTSKADLVASLQEAFAYCDKAYNGMTDAAGGESVKLRSGSMAKINVLTANGFHTAEHYGNLITYLRLKNIVPPSSEPGGMAPAKKES